MENNICFKGLPHLDCKFPYTEIKPCPFCGSIPSPIFDEHDNGVYFVCQGCGITTAKCLVPMWELSLSKVATKESLINDALNKALYRWNRRV